MKRAAIIVAIALGLSACAGSVYHVDADIHMKRYVAIRLLPWDNDNYKASVADQALAPALILRSQMAKESLSKSLKAYLSAWRGHNGGSIAVLQVNQLPIKAGFESVINTVNGVRQAPRLAKADELAYSVLIMDGSAIIADFVVRAPIVGDASPEVRSANWEKVNEQIEHFIESHS